MIRCRHGVDGMEKVECMPCHTELLSDVLQAMENWGMPMDEDESILMTRIATVLANKREPR